MKRDCTECGRLTMHVVMQIGEGQAGGQAGRQTDRQAGRQAGRQTDRQAGKCQINKRVEIQQY